MLHHYFPTQAYMRLYDAEGKLSYCTPVRGGENNLPLINLASGVYFYEVVDGEVSSGNEKIVKM